MKSQRKTHKTSPNVRTNKHEERQHKIQICNRRGTNWRTCLLTPTGFEITCQFVLWAFSPFVFFPTQKKHDGKEAFWGRSSWHWKVWHRSLQLRSRAVHKTPQQKAPTHILLSHCPGRDFASFAPQCSGWSTENYSLFAFWIKHYIPSTSTSALDKSNE